MKEWKLPNWEEEERDHVLLPRIQETVDIMLRGGNNNEGDKSGDVEYQRSLNTTKEGGALGSSGDT